MEYLEDEVVRSGEAERFRRRAWHIARGKGLWRLFGRWSQTKIHPGGKKYVFRPGSPPPALEAASP
jgi:hypothetical protein